MCYQCCYDYMVSTSNELSTCYHTPNVSLHGMSDVSVTSVVSPLTHHSSEMMTVSTGNVPSGTMNSSTGIQLLTNVESFRNPRPQISSSATSYLPASLPGSELLLPTIQGVPLTTIFNNCIAVWGPAATYPLIHRII